MAARTPTPNQQRVLDAIAQTPDAPTRTIAQRLHREHPQMFPTIERARSAVRNIRGNNGDKRRKQSADVGVYRPNGTAGWKPSIPDPVVETWEPFVMDGCSRVLILSDIHVPYHDAEALKLAIETGKKQRVDGVIINGDLTDFYQLSRFLKDPSRRDVAAEIQGSADLLLYIRHVFPKARSILKKGNHDERFDHYIWNAAPALWKLDGVRLDNILANYMRRRTHGVTMDIEEYGWEMIGDQRPIMLGKLPVLHGHELPKGLASPVNPARGAYMRTAHTVLIGHGHRTSQHVEPDMWGSEVSCWSTGCLCGLRPEYARINKWNHGFAVCEIHSGGEFELHNYRVADGKVRAS